MGLSLEMALLTLSSAKTAQSARQIVRKCTFSPQSYVQFSPSYRCNVLGAQLFCNFLSFRERVKIALWCDLSAYRPAQFEGWNPVSLTIGVVRFQFPVGVPSSLLPGAWLRPFRGIVNFGGFLIPVFQSWILDRESDVHHTIFSEGPTTVIS
jgi:hypothetical protein